MKRIKRLAGGIAKALAREGFTVHRYDAETTDSVYLRLDWGACNTIRVSDHPGYAHAGNRYNIGPWIEMPMRTEEKYPRFYWPEDRSAALIAKCIADRDARIGWSGRGGYDAIVAKKRREARKSRSKFWERARKVKP